jgi:hypothetical protein
VIQCAGGTANQQVGPIQPHYSLAIRVNLIDWNSDIGVRAPTDAVIRRAKLDGHSSVYHGGLVSLLARMRLLQPIATRGRIEKPSREARLENDQFEWDRANLTIIKVSGDAERQDRA